MLSVLLWNLQYIDSQQTIYLKDLDLLIFIIMAM